VSPLSAVQRIYTRYQAIADDTLYLADGRPRAIFELHPPNLALADDETLEATAQQLAVVFSNLPFLSMLLFRFVAVDLEQHAAAAERIAELRGHALARAGRDYAALGRHLSRTLVLLEPRVYLVVGLEGAHDGTGHSLVRLTRSWFAGRSRRRGPAQHTLAGPSDTELLDERGEQVALAFAAIGARPHRLDNVEIAELLYACWCPERSRREPLDVRRRAA
jgi:hypothetical protein